MRTADKARGKWRGVLMQLGIDQRFLTGKHGPCPFCEGRDRFRWDNDKGNGSFFCSQCGAGDGFQFLQKFKGWDFRECAKQVDEIVSGVKIEPVRKLDEARSRDLKRELWAASKPISEGDLAWQYLSGRGVLPAKMPSCLRFVPFCRAPDGSNYPAMIALVSDANGEAGTIHRTFLGPNGKADMVDPRAIMPGQFPEGGAVRLFEAGANLGIAEGIETAISAAKRFRIPTWAALTANALANWMPPQGVERITIFGDCDHSYTGQAASFALAKRLVGKFKIPVDVKIPETMGTDWADA